ncbi:MAG: EamA family transporter RarD [Steroidobacteraceae bacterium]
MNTAAERRAGVLAGAVAFFIWGLLPLYLKPLHALAAAEIAAWRYLMACVFALGCLAFRRELRAAWDALRTPAVLLRLVCSSALLGTNWTLYVWGVGHGQVLTTSLGYFINPLVNVLLGVLVLSERLGKRQWLAVGLAALGVVLLSISGGQVPWIALALAVSFSLYGLIRKTAPVAALPGLAVETLLAMPIALWLLGSVIAADAHAAYSGWIRVLLLCSGPITAIPLILFAYAARRIDYSLVGMLQYIGPSLQFLCGLVVFHEPLSLLRLGCFALIWLALIVYASSQFTGLKDRGSATAPLNALKSKPGALKMNQS